MLKQTQDPHGKPGWFWSPDLGTHLPEKVLFIRTGPFPRSGPIKPLWQGFLFQRFVSNPITVLLASLASLLVRFCLFRQWW